VTVHEEQALLSPNTENADIFFCKNGKKNFWSVLEGGSTSRSPRNTVGDGWDEPGHLVRATPSSGAAVLNPNSEGGEKFL
jgi:hypothetical protein